jgi:hypothetical protein
MPERGTMTTIFQTSTGPRGAVAALLALMLGAVGCSDVAGPEGVARVQVHLTDAPADYLEVAEVCVSQIYLQGGDDEEENEDEGGRTILWDKDPDAQCFDLLELQGVSASLTDGGVEVPAGTYGQLRFIVESARVVLAEGYTFSDGESTEMDLIVPSGAQTGIKVLLLDPIFAEAGTLTEVTVDADVEQNFHILGNPESPAGIQGVLFTPVLVEIPELEP